MASQTASNTGPSGLGRFLFHHEIDEYPASGRRSAYLALAVLATIALYYTYFTQTGVTPNILQYYHMSFSFYVWIVVISNLIGAFASLPASKTDALGRSNVVIYGLLIVGLLICFAVPACTGEWAFAVVICIIGLVEGAILVATPALIRDFSPQVGRASAMGFWAVGPVAGSLITSIVATNTLSHLTAWQDQFHISGIFTLVVFVLALIWLKDLSPKLRDQLMVSEMDKALVAAKAMGLSEAEVAEATAHPWKQILKGDLVISAVGISVFLLLYYAATAFFTIYWATVFKSSDGVNLSTSAANSLNIWFWAVDIIALVVFGWLSDKLRVRKPFMLAGTIGGIIMLIIFLGLAGNAYTGADTIIIVEVLLAACISMVYAPWMASYTELVEAKNPALVGTGLALWGWILRLTVGLSFIFLPLVVTAVNPVVDNLQYAQTPPNGDAPFNVQQFQLEHPKSVAFAEANASWLKPLSTDTNYALATAARLHPTPANIAALTKAVGPVIVGKALKYETQLVTLVVPYRQDLSYLAAHQNELLALQNGVAESPSQWQHWFWVCVGGMVLFLPTVFLTKGRWSPAKAKEDEDAYEAKVQEELKQLQGVGA
jgi:MFS family permease